MTGVDETAKIDESIKQLIFFYELTKMGAVNFDFNNKVHMDTLILMINRVVELQEVDISKIPLYKQMEHMNRLKLYELIIFQILKHSIKLSPK